MRDTCYTCYRPLALCLCGELPEIHNRTELVVLQHPRERTHPFGSARMLTQSLRRAQLHVAQRETNKSVAHPLALADDAVLLYPRPEGQDLGALASTARPSQVVLLDGTWSQAHRLYRDNPYLWALPHFQFEPAQPSRYQVRREPKAHCVSTLEAGVELLRRMEPDLRGLSELLSVFERMNVEQVALRRRGQGRPRRKKRRDRPTRAIPQALLRPLERLVVVYGEPNEISSCTDVRRRGMLQWTALRLGASRDLFNAFCWPLGGAPSSQHLERLELEPGALSGAGSEAEAMGGFGAFLRPGDTLLAWNGSTFKRLPPALLGQHDCVQLKAVYCNLRGGRCGMLEEVMVREDLTAFQLPVVPGRARRRLGHAVAVTVFLLEQAALLLGPLGGPGVRSVTDFQRMGD